MVCFKVQENFGHPDVLADTHTDAARIVEDESGRDASDPVKDVLQCATHSAVSPPKSCM